MRPAPQTLTAEEARAIFDYNPDTGEIVRKVSDKRFAGKIAGAVHRTGYRVIKVGLKQVLAHRLAWLLATGEWPDEFYIDHINHDKLDNRINNLRKATLVENRMNSKKSWGRAGFRGVQINNRIKRGKKWFASISVRGKEQYLGSHSTPEEAAQAYRKAAIELHGKFAVVE